MNSALVQTFKNLSFRPSLIPLHLTPIMTTLKISPIPELTFSDTDQSPMSISPTEKEPHSPTNILKPFSPDPNSGRGKNDGLNKARERIISECINGVLDITPGSKLDTFRKNLDKYLNNFSIHKLSLTLFQILRKNV